MFWPGQRLAAAEKVSLGRGRWQRARALSGGRWGGRDKQATAEEVSTLWEEAMRGECWEAPPGCLIFTFQMKAEDERGGGKFRNTLAAQEKEAARR